MLAIGNAPTALFRLLELVDDGAPTPAAVLGGPVGFVGSAQSKQELDRPPPRHVLPGGYRSSWRQRDGRRRRQRDRQRQRMTDADGARRGTLWGVGLGPGDPELVTVKAARLIGQADVVAYHSARHGRSIARGIAEPYLRPGQIEEHLVYPVTTETTDHPGGYAGAMEDFYREAAERIAAHLDAGRDVALLAEGDPLFYSSYMHMHTRLTERFDAVIVPGVTSVSAASAATGIPLVQGDEVLSIIPGTLPVDELKRRLADTDAAVVLKLGRSYPAVREALSSVGTARTTRTTWSARARRSSGCCPPPTSTTARCRTSRSPCCRATAARHAPAGTVAVVGLGPGDADWMTPQSRRELAAATDLIGYGPYLDRIRPRDGQRRHPSDNTDEPARAPAGVHARRGRAAPSRWSRPATPASSRWPPRCSRRPSSGRASTVRVIPAMTAAQAVASRVGAPLGHDYAVISLSDRLKPWDVIAARLTAAADGRPGAGDLQPGVEDPHLAGRRDARPAAGAPRPGHSGGDRPRRVRPARRREGGAAGRPGPRRGRHAVPADRRLVADPVVLTTGCSRRAATRRSDTVRQP